MPTIPLYPDNDKENPRPVKRGAMQASLDGDLEATPRPKRRRDLQGQPFLSAPPSPTKSDSTDLESHHSGRLSPTKQLRHLEERQERTVVFYNFHDDAEGSAPMDVTAMHDVIQKYADGVGILGYPEGLPLQDLGQADQARFKYPWANNPARLLYGRMPPLSEVADLVTTARAIDRGAGKDEETWNSEVQLPLLKLAKRTSLHDGSLVVGNV